MRFSKERHKEGASKILKEIPVETLKNKPFGENLISFTGDLKLKCEITLLLIKLTIIAKPSLSTAISILESGEIASLFISERASKSNVYVKFLSKSIALTLLDTAVKSKFLTGENIIFPSL